MNHNTHKEKYGNWWDVGILAKVKKRTQSEERDAIFIATLPCSLPAMKIASVSSLSPVNVYLVNVYYLVLFAPFHGSRGL